MDGVVAGSYAGQCARIMGHYASALPVHTTEQIEILPRLGRHHQGPCRAEHLEEILNRCLRASNDPA